MGVKKQKRGDHHCPLCDGRISLKKSAQINDAKVFKANVVLYKTGEMGAYIAGVHTKDIKDIDNG